jgi:hypothetical protein
VNLTHQSDTRPAHQLLFIARDTGPVRMHAQDRRVELFDNKYCEKIAVTRAAPPSFPA